MAYFLFVGDMLVMAFMICVVVWVSLSANRKSIDDSARIPLEDEAPHG